MTARFGRTELPREQVQPARAGCMELDRKLRDTVLVPVDMLPDEVGGGEHQSGSEDTAGR